MRFPLLTILLVLLGLFAASLPAASSQPGPTLSAAPNPVNFGQTVVIKGKRWPVIEFCSRTVRLSLRSAQNAFPLGTKRVRVNGRFRFEWVPRRARVGAGRWRVVARMRCESGKDGSPVPVRRSAPLRIR
jgi:hypothetical protein